MKFDLEASYRRRVIVFNGPRVNMAEGVDFLEKALQEIDEEFGEVRLFPTPESSTTEYRLHLEIVEYLYQVENGERVCPSLSLYLHGFKREKYQDKAKRVLEKYGYKVLSPKQKEEAEKRVLEKYGYKVLSPKQKEEAEKREIGRAKGTREISWPSLRLMCY